MVTPRGISAAEALKAARKALPGESWLLTNLSNTGVAFGSTTAGDLSGPEEALMSADGTAGQWVLEFFQDQPEKVSEGGRTGVAYPFRKVLVTKNRASVDSRFPQIRVTKGLVAISDQSLKGLDKARRLAVQQAKGAGHKFNVLSVKSQNPSDGVLEWVFRFYDTKRDAIVYAVLVSGDGSQVVDSGDGQPR